MVLSFALVLCIEKIVTDHHHPHGDEERKIRKTILATINRDYSEHYQDEEGHNHDHGDKEHQHNHQKVHASNLLENPDNMTQLSQPMMGKKIDEDDEEEESFKNVLRAPNAIAKRMSFVQSVKKSVAMDRKKNVPK